MHQLTKYLQNFLLKKPDSVRIKIKTPIEKENIIDKVRFAKE